jgi:8-oxo-dGTP pyrophosphatase MutT (NUDIX family)
MDTTAQIVQYFSSDFLVAAGSVLFRQSPELGLQVCILYNNSNGRWILPKGRKDCGESIEAAAVRETAEETGYACELLPCRMPTRAPEPDINMVDNVRIRENTTEPFAVTIKDVREGTGIKVIWWYLTRVKSYTAERQEGTQTDSERFDSRWVGVEETAECLTSPEHREVLAKAVALVKASLAHGDNLFGVHSPTFPVVCAFLATVIRNPIILK